MSIEFWFSICATFVGGGLAFFVHITKKEKTGAIIAMIISFLIAGICFFMGVYNNSSTSVLTGVDPVQIENTTKINEISNTKQEGDLQQGKMFTNYFETHTPDSIACSLSVWSSRWDKDIRGQTHEYEEGLKLDVSKTFYVTQTKLTSDIHLTYNPNYSGNKTMEGKIVLGNESSGTKAMAEVSILVDGKEVWKAEEKITGVTVNPVEYSVDLEDCKSEVIIRTTCYVESGSIQLGFFGK